MMMTHPPLLGQWSRWGQCGPVGWWGHTAAHCGQCPHSHTADILCPGQHTPAKLGWEVVIHNLHPTVPTHLTASIPRTLEVEYSTMAEDVHNIETLTMVIYNVMCIMLRHKKQTLHFHCHNDISCKLRSRLVIRNEGGSHKYYLTIIK